MNQPDLSYADLQAQNPAIDLTRGRPAAEFLDLATGLESSLPADLQLSGTDLRNYTGFPGLAGARALGSELLGAPAASVLVAGNSSLAGLWQVLMLAWFHGLNGQPPWSSLSGATCICPVPGYDRHFRLLDNFHIAASTVPLTGDGPDMAMLEEQMADKTARAVLLVPRHSNPTGDVWSAAKLKRLMQLATEAPPDFLLLVDHAYAIHDFRQTPEQPSLYQLAEEQGVLDRLFLLGSTSKIGYAGSGLAFTACSEQNLQRLLSVLAGLSLGASALDQARHCAFFNAADAMRTHFGRIAPLLRHRFEIAEAALAPLLSRDDVLYRQPSGGYFISLSLPHGTARLAVKLAAEKGVKVSAAGSTFPGNHDPDDSNIRLAPTSPPLEQLETAMQVIAASALEAIRQKN